MPSPFAAAPVDPDEVTIRIGGSTWRFWDDVEINFGLDTYTTVSFHAPFDARRRDLREAFRPFSFAPVEVYAGTDLVLTGIMLDAPPDRDEDKAFVTVNCYALPGVLLDSHAPVSMLPFEARGLTLLQIARPLCQAFGFDAVVEGDPGPAFKRVKQKLDGKIQTYLVELAQQRGFVLSNTPMGDLVFRKAVSSGRPVASLVQGQPPLLSVKPTFNARDYFSEITGVVGAKVTRSGSKYTETNPRLRDALRCETFRIDKADKADAPGAVRARMGRMFGNAFAVSLELPTWRDPAGKLWHANTTIKVEAPDAMIYSPYEFVIRTVSLRKNVNAQTATLGCVLPGVFSGDIPPTLPWDHA